MYSLTHDRKYHFIIAIALACILAIVLLKNSGSSTDCASNPVSAPLETAAVVKSKDDTTSQQATCLDELSSGRWELATDGCPPVEPGVLRVCENTLTPYPRHWVWDKHGTAADCVPRELRYDRIAALLQNKRIGLVGDSHMRKLYGYLTTFTETTKLHPSYDEKAHEDFKTVLESTNTSVEFYWRAELRSTTKKLQAWLLKGNPPDFVVMDPSAHQAKWARNFTQFMEEIPALVRTTQRFHERFGPQRPMFWVISPPFHEPFSTNENITWIYSLKKFNAELRTAGFLRPEGPVIPIDLFKIAEACMDWCYRDVTHVSPVVNTLLLQIITGVYDYVLNKMPT